MRLVWRNKTANDDAGSSSGFDANAAFNKATDAVTQIVPYLPVPGQTIGDAISAGVAKGTSDSIGQGAVVAGAGIALGVTLVLYLASKKN